MLAGIVLGAYLFLANRLFGSHDNETFAALRIEDCKHFLRMHVRREGRLAIYAVGLQYVARDWRLITDGPRHHPWYEPGDDLQPRFIEPSIVL